nr:hypothetical protein DSAG12_02663 [Candidatus Prometheoarchaeum syntrophicum]
MYNFKQDFRNRKEMENIKIFISYRETERDYREGFEGLLQNPNSELRGIPISSRNDVRAKGEQAVKNYIKEKIIESDLMICLIGNDSHNSTYVDYEMDVATSKQIPIIGVRIPNTSGGGPNLFIKRELLLLDWNTSNIAQEIEDIFEE